MCVSLDDVSRTTRRTVVHGRMMVFFLVETYINFAPLCVRGAVITHPKNSDATAAVVQKKHRTLHRKKATGYGRDERGHFFTQVQTDGAPDGAPGQRY